MLLVFTVTLWFVCESYKWDREADNCNNHSMRLDNKWVGVLLDWVKPKDYGDYSQYNYPPN